MKDSNNLIRTVAITGASGLLGRYLSNYFRKNEWQVNALVRNVAAYPFKVQGIKIFKCDLPEVIDQESIKSIDVLIHCAYMTRFTNIEEAKRVNEEGTMKLYDLARKMGVKKFVFVSSRAARAGAKSYYARSKYKIEQRLDSANDLIIRPGLVLSSEAGLFARMVKQTRKLPFVPLFGGGNQRFNTIHIEDLCKIFGWAVENNLSGVINAAESEGITMRELLRAVLEESGQNKPLVSVPGRPFVALLQLLEFFKFKLPVSSENLRGLLNRDSIDAPLDDRLKQGGIKIRSARESIKDLMVSG
jgi:NADH dehydrogenase